MTKTIAAATLLAALVLFAGCPDFTGGIPCTRDDQCPSNYVCRDTKCVKGKPDPTSPLIKATENSLAFGSVQVGLPPKTIPVTITNEALSQSPVVVTVSLKNTPASFTMDNNGKPFTLPPKKDGGKLTINVTFTPTELVTVEGTLVITASSPSTEVKEIPLSGTGIIATIFSVDPTNLDFGMVSVGLAPGERILTVRNVTDPGVTIEVSGAVVSGQDVFSSDTPNFVQIAPGEEISIKVTFTPPLIADYSGTLDVNCISPVERSERIQIKGIGVTKPMFTVTPASWDFKDLKAGLETAQTKITVKNITDPPATIKVSGELLEGSPFSSDTDAAHPKNIPSGGQADITVTYAPQYPGSDNTNMTVSCNVPYSPTAGVSFKGHATMPTMIVADKKELNFGQVAAQTLPKVLDLKISNMTIPDQQIKVKAYIKPIDPPRPTKYKVTPDIEVPIAAQSAGGYYTFRIAYAPDAIEINKDTLVIEVTDPKTLFTVAEEISLTGSGKEPSLFTVSPESHSFGFVPVGTLVEQDFTVTNITDQTTPPGFTFNIKSTINPASDVFASLSGTFVPVEAGKAVTMKTTYLPIEVTTNNGTMVVESDVAIAAKKPVALTGTGSSPMINVDPGSWNFGIMHVSMAQVPNVPVTITNDSSSPLRIDSISLSGGADDRLVIDPNNCAPFPKALPSKLDACTFYIKLTPKSPGLIDRSISIVSNAGDTVSVKLTGEVRSCDIGTCDLGGFCDCMRIVRGGDSCATAEDIRPDGASNFDDSKGYEQVVEGNLVKIEGNACTLGDVRWFTFYAFDDMTLETAQKRDPFHVRVELYKDSTGDYDDNVAMDVYTIMNRNPSSVNCTRKFVCGPGTSADALCDSNGCTKLVSNECTTLITGGCGDVFEYKLDGTPTSFPPIGECGCKTVAEDCLNKTAAECLKNDCLNDSQRFYIRLYRRDSTPLTCKKYKLFISNGKYTDCPFQ